MNGPTKPFRLPTNFCFISNEHKTCQFKLWSIKIKRLNLKLTYWWGNSRTPPNSHHNPLTSPNANLGSEETYSFFIDDCFADLLFLPLSWIRNSQIQSKPHFDSSQLFSTSRMTERFFKFWKVLIGRFMIILAFE